MQETRPTAPVPIFAAGPKTDTLLKSIQRDVKKAFTDNFKPPDISGLTFRSCFGGKKIFQGHLTVLAHTVVL